MVAQSTLMKVAFTFFAGVSSAEIKQEPAEAIAVAAPAQASVYQAVSSKVSAFEARLSELEFENKQKLSSRQTEFDTKLKAQRDANAAMTSANAELKREVSELQKTTASLRYHAQEVQKDNLAWKQDYESLQANLTTAMELTTNTLGSFDVEAAAPELRILSELDAEDKTRMAQSAHSARFDEIVSHRHMSLLATNTNGVENPRSILKVLDAGIEDMAQEFERKKQDLDAQYAKLFQSEKVLHESLVDEQDNLTKEKTELLAIEAKLRAAVAHLEATNVKLSEKGRAIRLYAQRLGIKALPAQHGVVRKAEALPHEQQQEDQAVEPRRQAVKSEQQGEKLEFLQSSRETQVTSAVGGLVNLLTRR